MNFLGMGSLEILAILVIALIVLGPERMLKNARRIGDSIRELKRVMWKAENYLDEDNLLSSPNPTIEFDKKPSNPSLIKDDPTSNNETSTDELHETKSDQS